MFFRIQEGFLNFLLGLWFSTWVNIFNWNLEKAANSSLKENT